MWPLGRGMSWFEKYSFLEKHHRQKKTAGREPAVKRRRDFNLEALSVRFIIAVSEIFPGETDKRLHQAIRKINEPIVRISKKS